MSPTATTASDTSAARTARARRGGPHPGALGIVSLGLTLASLVAAALGDGRAYVTSSASTAAILQHFHDHGLAARVSAMLLFGSAVPLGILAATTYTRLLRLGVRVPGPSIGFFGGVAASLMLMVSALADWVLARPEIGSDAGVLHALLLVSFAAGGVGFVVGLGLLVAGVAVPALVLGLLPRPLAWLGLAVAVVSEVSFLSMAAPPVDVALPVGRYGGLLWLIAAGFLLPTRRSSGEPR